MKLAKSGARTILFAVLLLFFLQALSDFIQSIYAFGLLVTAFTIQLAAVLLLFTPLALMLVRRRPSRPWILSFAYVAILGRLLEPLLEPGGRLVACGISVGAFLLLFPSLLGLRPASSSGGTSAASGLLLALMLSILLRTAGSSVDLSEYGLGQILAWVFALLAVVLLWRADVAASPPAAPVTSLQSDRSPSTPRVLGLCIGLSSVVLVLYFAFVSPTVIARWTGYSFPAILIILLLALVTFAVLSVFTSLFRGLSRAHLLLWNAAFVLALVLTILPHQVSFPAAAGGYPLDAPSVPPLAALPLFLMLILSPVVVIDFQRYLRQLAAESPSLRQLGAGFVLGALFLLVMVFFHVFTTIYDYAAPIGTLFRDRFWLVYLLAGLGLALPLFLVPGDSSREEHNGATSSFTPVTAGLLALLAIVALFLTSSRPVAAPASAGLLRIMTFNIQQGFDKVGDEDLPGQLAAIRRVAPDLLALQESDTARIANGNVDAVRFFADNLGMYSYYGPTSTTGTFGIALLSKYPIQEPRTFFMYSAGEQTAAIQAQIQVGSTPYNVFVTHLGNDGPMVQLQDVLQRVDDLPNVILMGDFNFTPLTPQYDLATQSLADAWRIRWPTGRQIAGLEDRIDLILVSPGTQVREAEYVPNPDSDHPYLYIVVQPVGLALHPSGQLHQ